MHTVCTLSSMLENLIIIWQTSCQVFLIYWQTQSQEDKLFDNYKRSMKHVLGICVAFYNTKRMHTNLRHTKSRLYYSDNYKSKRETFIYFKNVWYPQYKRNATVQKNTKKRNGVTMYLCMVVLARWLSFSVPTNLCFPHSIFITTHPIFTEWMYHNQFWCCLILPTRSFPLSSVLLNKLLPDSFSSQKHLPPSIICWQPNLSPYTCTF